MTATVSADADQIDSGYEIPAMAQYVDILNVMTFNFHGIWHPYTHHHAPLYQYAEDTKQELNVDFAIDYYIYKGFPKEKISLGMGLFGKCWSLTDGENNNGILAPTTENGLNVPLGKYTDTLGVLGYNEVSLGLFFNISLLVLYFENCAAFVMLKVVIHISNGIF